MSECVFNFFLWVCTRKRTQGLKKRVICIFGINVVVFDVVFYLQRMLRPCGING